MKYKDLKLGDNITVSHMSIKATVIYVKHNKKTTDLTLKLKSDFRLSGTFDSNAEVKI